MCIPQHHSIKLLFVAGRKPDLQAGDVNVQEPNVQQGAFTVETVPMWRRWCCVAV